MTSNEKQTQFTQLIHKLSATTPSSWDDINQLLTQVRNRASTSEQLTREAFVRRFAQGTSFLTFDYGIDGVSIEISKYARALEGFYEAFDGKPLHFIGGDFYPQADSVLEADWRRLQIDGINGWSKWHQGRWFAKLFYEDMPENSTRSAELSGEIFRQAVSIAERLGDYLIKHDIALLIPVNIASNPGNLALAVAFVLVTESLGLYVINSNHDFYWEGGKPPTERKSEDPPGVRDHFFRNVDNQSFFHLFKRLYPWNGRHWLQVNINRLQSDRLVQDLGFPREKVFELSTSVSDKFFEDYTQEDVKQARLRMGYILSDGEPILHSIPVDDHLANLADWMGGQKPCFLGARAGLSLDPTSETLIYLLQPTRVIARKRIERNLFLIRALLEHSPFFNTFEKDERRQLVLHITGPTPIEHQADLEEVLHAYQDVVRSAPQTVADRIFLAFSVGNEDHPAFHDAGLQRMTIEDIYRMASAVVFPSETEGRGLPIVEASASMVPLICSRYRPFEVFSAVVGEDLADEHQIRYTHFPEGDFSPAFLDEVTTVLLHPEEIQPRLQHNRSVVRHRYSTSALRETFVKLVEALGADVIR
ncbi:MAG: hypothetical protein GTO14_00050 [Anaerolineales bacterium]|nr:hypothetical protein [Anaerolineales bacterium]